MRRRLRDHAARDVEAFAAGASSDLLEVAHREHGRLLPVVFAQLREEHRADRDVHPDAERVGAADDLEQPLLSELLHQQAILRQHPRVMDAHAVR